MRRNWRKARVERVDKVFKANERLTSLEVSLINEEGVNIGVVKTAVALKMAQDAGLDLVEVNPKAEPPVAKIIDLGQFKYELDKKMQRQKAAQKKIETKNIRLTFRIGKHDIDVRIAQAEKFLKDSDKVKIDLLLRGREKQHFVKARELMETFVNEVKAKEGLSVFEDQTLTRLPNGFTIILANKK